MNRTTSLATLALLLAFYGTATAQTTRGFVAINGGLQSGSKGFHRTASLTRRCSDLKTAR